MQQLALPRRLGALALAATLLIAACGAGTGAPSPTRTITPNASSTAQPGGSAFPSLAPSGAATPVTAPWPSGWEAAFCTLFADAIVMQELAVDIGRALDDDAADDARALTAELAAAAADVREQLRELPPWEAAVPFERQMLELVDLADVMATRYERHFDTGRAKPLDAARQAGGEMNEVVPRILERLDPLARAGLSCPGIELELETPPEP